MRAVLVGLEGEEVAAMDIPQWMPYIDVPRPWRPRMSDFTNPSDPISDTLRVRRFHAADALRLGDEIIAQVYRERL